MKKIVLSIFFCILLFTNKGFCTPLFTNPCKGYVIGFKGLNESFNSVAFQKYADRLGYCGKSFSWFQDKEALQYIQTLKKPYRLYGFSRGAQTISVVLKQTKTKPEYVLTIGAYKTTNVNFDEHRVRYDNFFDQSGIGQKSPGVFFNVSHADIEKEVSDFLIE
jgi:hypothetical protein